MSQTTTSTSAKILYRPIGIVSSVLAGLIANAVFKRVWRKAATDGETDPPKPLERDYRMRQILAAAVLQGAIYAVVKAATDRGGARAFEKMTGEWPGK